MLQGYSEGEKHAIFNTVKSSLPPHPDPQKYIENSTKVLEHIKIFSMI